MLNKTPRPTWQVETKTEISTLETGVSFIYLDVGIDGTARTLHAGEVEAHHLIMTVDSVNSARAAVNDRHLFKREKNKKKNVTAPKAGDRCTLSESIAPANQTPGSLRPRLCS